MQNNIQTGRRNFLLLILLVSIAGMPKCFAYDIAAVCETGQTMYYKITDVEEHFVKLINPNDVGSVSGWDGYTKPTGNLILPKYVYDADNIQYTLTTIAAYSFESCRGLTTINIPNSVTTIEWWAFQDCRGLTSITIPNSVTTIDDYAFMDCQSLTSVTIPGSVTRIGDNAFANCYELSSVTMLPLVPPTGANFDPFNHDDKLLELNVPYASWDAYQNAIHWCEHANQMRTMAYKSIDGYGTGNDKWAFIASPLVADGGISPTAVNDLTSGEFDLYRLNESTTNIGSEWENYKNPIHTDGFKLVNGQGYLYASQDDVDLVFKGDFNTNAEMDVALNFTSGSNIAGFNLVGNPFPTNAYASRSYYVMNDAGDAVIAIANSTSIPIPPCTGVIVQAAEDEQSPTITFSTTPPEITNLGNINFILTQQTSRGNKAMDNVVVSFNDGDQLGKFVFKANNAQLCIPQNGVDYAIVVATRQSEMPINFKTAQNGSFTLTAISNGVVLNYLHLIDNLTGKDVDLLQNPSYTFNAQSDDFASRFRLVFGFNGLDEIETNNDFAFFNGREWVINNHDYATVRIVDMTGRIIVSLENGTNTVSTEGIASGMYMLQMIKGSNVKTQKIVVK